MNNIEKICDFLESKMGISSEILLALLLTLISYLIIKLVKICLRNILSGVYEQKRAFALYQKFNVILTIINCIIIFMIWDKYLNNIITIISFVSAALTLALRELIFNFFAGIYIKVKKPFVVEDRIELNDIKGDVISISALSFELLEVGNNINGDQSTGIIINVPNSFSLTQPIKNYEKNFKYIWSEITVKTTFESDINSIKELLLEIINSNEVVKRIPKKMENEIEDISLDYRIYYNKLEPIIYSKVVDNHIEFYIRYLVHPKKNRYVEDDVWTKILEANKEGKIKLYEG